MNSVKIGKPKAILLDWDNTIVSSWGVIQKCLNITFKTMGHAEWPPEDFANNRENIHHSLRDSFPRIFGDKWEEAREIYYKAFKAIHLQEIKLIEGARETLEKLQKTGIYIAVVSNKTGDYLREEVTHLGTSKYFKKVIGATDAARDKPHPDPLLMALEGSGISESDYKASVWMVGDSKTDIEAGANTGVISVLYGDADLSEEHQKDIAVKITDQQDFQNIIDSWQ